MTEKGTKEGRRLVVLLAVLHVLQSLPGFAMTFFVGGIEFWVAAAPVFAVSMVLGSVLNVASAAGLLLRRKWGWSLAGFSWVWLVFLWARKLAAGAFSDFGVETALQLALPIALLFVLNSKVVLGVFGIPPARRLWILLVTIAASGVLFVLLTAASRILMRSGAA